MLTVAVLAVVLASPGAFAADAYYLNGSITSGPQFLKDVAIEATDEPAVEVVSGGILYMGPATVSHELTGTDAVTGAVLVSGGSDARLEDVEIATEGVSTLGANGVHSTDPGTVVTLKNVDIYCGEYAARGIYTTIGGTIIAENVTVETWKGGGGAAIATSGENGGNIQVRGGVFTTNAGKGSAAAFSTGFITVSDAILTAQVLEETSTWYVTADSYVTVLSVAPGKSHRNRHGEKRGAMPPFAVISLMLDPVRE